MIIHNDMGNKKRTNCNFAFMSEITLGCSEFSLSTIARPYPIQHIEAA